MGIFSKKKIETQSPKTTDFQSINAAPESEVAFQTQGFGKYEEFDEAHRTHFRPESYNDTGEIADTLIRFKEVTVSFKDLTDKHERRRVIDFLTGVMYALEGNYEKVDDGVFYFSIKH
jgi:cell division inhibitor SepF